MENSPITPKKRYSCSSEYATPKESDDSDSSLYYSFVLSEDDNVVNKENSINGGQWTITDTANSPIVHRVPKAKTPLLRKVLQTNHTPRNRNNKRVSFSHLPTPTAIVKGPKKHLDVALDQSVSYDLKPIEESLPRIEHKNEEKSEEVGDSKISIDSANDTSSNFTDELHNTIIENLSSAANSTLTSNNEECPTATFGSQSSIENSEESVNEPQKIKPQMASVSNVSRSIEEILSEGSKNVQQTRNTTKIDRQRLNLVNDSRKSILPIAKKTTRATTYKRRSSTYEPRKVDLRKSLGVLKVVASKVKKTIGVQKIPSSNNQIGVSSTVAKPLIQKSDSTTSRMPTLKPRLTLANQHPLRVPIVSTRQSISTSVRAQRRETKNSLTTLAVARASTSSDLTRSSSSNHAAFIKPSGVPVRSKPTSTVVNGKCQYCDKYFAKQHGMTTHLLEKCEKIPASARRQLMQKEKQTDEVNSKQVSRRKTYAFRQDFDSISKYSRFFVNLTNEGASGAKRGDVESGLKNLRVELRKTKNAHSGITRTPSKPIRCHICKKLFLDCWLYADHYSQCEKLK